MDGEQIRQSCPNRPGCELAFLQALDERDARLREHLDERLGPLEGRVESIDGRVDQVLSVLLGGKTKSEATPTGAVDIAAGSVRVKGAAWLVAVVAVVVLLVAVIAGVAYVAGEWGKPELRRATSSSAALAKTALLQMEIWIGKDDPING